MKPFVIGIYRLTDDSIRCIHSDGQTHKTQSDTDITQRKLQGGQRWADILADALRGIWSEGVRGLVSIEGTHGQQEQWLQACVSLPREQEGIKECAPVGMHGIPWDASNPPTSGEAQKWESTGQSAQESCVGNTSGKRSGQDGPWTDKNRGAAPLLKVERPSEGGAEMVHRDKTVLTKTRRVDLGDGASVNLSYCRFQEGQVLGVRESAWRLCEKLPDGKTKTGRVKYWYSPIRRAPIHYAADHPKGWKPPTGAPPTGPILRDFRSKHEIAWRLKIPRFLPAWAVRTRIEITGVKVERLQEITNTDITAEGVTEELIRGMLRPAAAKMKTKAEHWVHGGDEGASYCYECCVKEVAAYRAKDPSGEYLVDGGYGSEGENTPSCETCGCRLENSLTAYGAEMEFDHFLEYGRDPNSVDDSYCFLQAMDALVWEQGKQHEYERGGDFQRSKDRRELMHRACWRTLWRSINGPQSWALNPWVWVPTFRVIEGGAK